MTSSSTECPLGLPIRTVTMSLRTFRTTGSLLPHGGDAPSVTPTGPGITEGRGPKGGSRQGGGDGRE